MTIADVHLETAEFLLRDPGDVTDERATNALLAIGHALVSISARLTHHEHPTNHPNPFKDEPT